MSRIPIRLPAQSKYHAKRTDGYASKAEARRGGELELLAKLDKITALRKQPKYLLIPKDLLGRAIFYIADFEYWDCEKQQTVIEDVKGVRTAVYRLKKRLMWHIQHRKIVEI